MFYASRVRGHICQKLNGDCEDGDCVPRDDAARRVDGGVFRPREDPTRSASGEGVHRTVGVPLRYFPLLAVCEFAGALGLVAGIWRPTLGVAAAIGLVLYFVGAIVSHLRAADFKGMGPAVFMLVPAAGVTHPPPGSGSRYLPSDLRKAALLVTIRKERDRVRLLRPTSYNPFFLTCPSLWQPSLSPSR